MEAQASKPTNPILIIACVVMILSCTAGIGALMGWIAASIANDEAALTADAPARAATPTSAPATVSESTMPHHRAGALIRPIHASLWQRATSLSDPNFACNARICAASL